MPDCCLLLYLRGLLRQSLSLVPRNDTRKINLSKIAHIDLGSRPLLLAPMEDVTDVSFRIVAKRMGADAVYTEFISSEAIIRQAAKSMKKMAMLEEERPLAIQIFGGNPDVMREAAQISEAACPDFIDINFRCPKINSMLCHCFGFG